MFCSDLLFSAEQVMTVAVRASFSVHRCFLLLTNTRLNQHSEVLILTIKVWKSHLNSFHKILSYMGIIKISTLKLDMSPANILLAFDKKGSQETATEYHQVFFFSSIFGHLWFSESVRSVSFWSGCWFWSWRGNVKPHVICLCSCLSAHAVASH